MNINEAIDQLDANVQKVPSNPLINTGGDDLVYWHEVREWLVELKDRQVIPEAAVEGLE